jgi:hypothetical protein
MTCTSFLMLQYICGGQQEPQNNNYIMCKSISVRYDADPSRRVSESCLQSLPRKKPQTVFIGTVADNLNTKFRMYLQWVINYRDQKGN